MCDHKISKDFQFCPYCGAKLEQQNNEQEEKKNEKKPLLFHDHCGGFVAVKMKPADQLQISEAADYIVKKVLDKRLDFTEEYVKPMLVITSLFNEHDTFLASESNCESGTIAKLKYAGLLGVAGKQKKLIHLYDDQYKEVEINEYVINPNAMYILYVTAEKLIYTMEKKYSDYKKKVEQKINEYEEILLKCKNTKKNIPLK